MTIDRDREPARVIRATNEPHAVPAIAAIRAAHAQFDIWGRLLALRPREQASPLGEVVGVDEALPIGCDVLAGKLTRTRVDVVSKLWCVEPAAPHARFGI